MKGELVLVRGLPGSGKSSLAALISVNPISADDFFIRHGRYLFDPSKLAEAHADCLTRTEIRLHCGDLVVVANTFSCRWEIQAYLELAAKVGCVVRVVDCFDGGLTDQELADRNIHGVPVQTIASMRRRWEHDWKAGNPIPPWQRNKR